MARILGPDFIALQVRDMERSRRFYVEALGLQQKALGPPHAIVFDTHPVPFAIREPLIPLDEANRLGWGVALWLNCDDADSLASQVEAAGAQIVQPLQDSPFGRVFSFLDPDGYRITVHQHAG